MGSPAVVSALASLSTSHPAEADLVARISAPVFVRVVPTVDASDVENAPRMKTHLVMLNSFMSAWSALVTDPIVSKWIVITLAVSVFLNWYLLKGLASQLPLPFPSAVTFPSAPAQTSEAPKMSRRWSGVGAADLAGYERERNAEAQNQGASADSGTPLEIAIPESRRFPRSYGRRGEDEDEQDSNEGSAMSGLTDSHSLSEISTAGPQTPPPFNAAAPSPVHLSTKPTINVAQELEDMVRRVIPAPTSGGLSPMPLQTDFDIHVGKRDMKELLELHAENPANVKSMSDEEIIMLSQAGKIPAYSLEKILGDFERAVFIRRALICKCSLECSRRNNQLTALHLI